MLLTHHPGLPAGIFHRFFSDSTILHNLVRVFAALFPQRLTFAGSRAAANLKGTCRVYHRRPQNPYGFEEDVQARIV